MNTRFLVPLAISGTSAGSFEIVQRLPFSRPPRIVIADDFETLRRGLKSLLGSFICGEAENGQQAVEKVMQLRPDVVILDLSMPVMNGLEAAKRIRSLVPETKIIVFSVHDGRTVKEEAFHAGAEAFLHKTANGEDILKTIAGVVNKIAG